MLIHPNQIRRKTIVWQLFHPLPSLPLTSPKLEIAGANLITVLHESKYMYKNSSLGLLEENCCKCVEELIFIANFDILISSF